MLIKLKRILDRYSEEELEDMELWVDCWDNIQMICIEDRNIVLITDEGYGKLQIDGKDWS